MKTLLNFIAAMSIPAIACQREMPVVPLALAEFNPKQTLVLLPAEAFVFKPNQDVVWRVAEQNGGTLNPATNQYTAPATAGVFTLILKATRNLSDSLVVKAVVSPKAEIFKALQKGNHVLSFRHALANLGNDQCGAAVDNWWRSCDVNVARQLSPQGNADAKAIGRVLKMLGVPVGRMLSSEFCRCFGTAQLMDFGLPVVQLTEITYCAYNTELTRYADTMQLISTQPTDGKVTVIVTHAGFSNPPSPAPLNDLLWGDAAVFQTKMNADAALIGILKLSDFTDLK